MWERINRGKMCQQRAFCTETVKFLLCIYINGGIYACSSSSLEDCLRAFAQVIIVIFVFLLFFLQRNKGEIDILSLQRLTPTTAEAGHTSL